jgi:hypothetical protein
VKKLLLAAPLLSLFACADDAALSNEESEVRGEGQLQTFVVGTFSSDRREARESLDRACDDAIAAQKQIAGTRYRSAKCESTGQSLVRNGNLFGANLRVRFRSDESGQSVVSSRTSTITSPFSSDPKDGYAAWQSGCLAELERAKVLFGSRLAGGGCDEPQTGTNRGAGLTSSFQAFILPPQGRTAQASGALRGEVSVNRDQALASWRTACETWSNAVAVSAGDRLLTVDCGAPENDLGEGAGNGYLFGSKTTLVASAGTDRGRPVSSALRSTGTLSASRAEAYATWTSRCNSDTELAKQLLAERFIAATCGEPNDVSSDGFMFSSSLTVIAAPAIGNQKVDVTAYVVGVQSLNENDARVSLEDAVTTDLRAHVTRTGARLASFEIDEPRDIVRTGYLFGARTELHFSFEGPQASRTTDKVRGPENTDESAAVLGWATACTDATTRVKNELGNRFLAATCGEPRRVGNAFESSFTTWTLQQGIDAPSSPTTNPTPYPTPSSSYPDYSDDEDDSSSTTTATPATKKADSGCSVGSLAPSSSLAGSLLPLGALLVLASRRRKKS